METTRKSDATSESKVILKPRHVKFLKAYAKCGDIGKAYLASGYRCKSKDVASACGSKLLKKLESRMSLQEKFDEAGLSDFELLHITLDLLRSKNQNVRARILPHVYRAKAWIGGEDLGESGARIIIQGGRVAEKPKEKKQDKPGKQAGKLFTFPMAGSESDS